MLDSSAASFEGSAPDRRIIPVSSQDYFESDGRSFLALAFPDEFVHSEKQRLSIPFFHPRVLADLYLSQRFVLLRCVVRVLLEAMAAASVSATSSSGGSAAGCGLVRAVASRSRLQQAILAGLRSSAVAPVSKLEMDALAQWIERTRLAQLTLLEQRQLGALLCSLPLDTINREDAGVSAGANPIAAAAESSGRTISTNSTTSMDRETSLNTAKAGAQSVDTYDALFGDSLSSRFKQLDDQLELDLRLSDDDEDGDSTDSAPDTVRKLDTVDALDECGARFATLMHQHLLLHEKSEELQSTPAAAGFESLESGSFFWAFHSESQNELLALIPGAKEQSVSWSTLRAFGVGWWLRSVTQLSELVEGVAKFEYQQQLNDERTKVKGAEPLDVALWHLLTNHKALVVNMYRLKNDTKMNEFFRKDFATDAKARSQASRNAFHLLSLQRFFHAVAFFALAGQIKDAIDIAIHKLHDVQLALVTARLYDHSFVASSSGGTDEFRIRDTIRNLRYRTATEYLLHEFIIKPFEALHQRTRKHSLKAPDANSSSTAADHLEMLTHYHENAVYVSLAYWLSGDYERSLSSLRDSLRCRTLSSPLEASGATTEEESADASASLEAAAQHVAPSLVFQAYQVLQRHHLVVRALQHKQRGKQPASGGDEFLDELFLYMSTIVYYLKEMNAPLLALLVLERFEEQLREHFAQNLLAGQSLADNQLATVYFIVGKLKRECVAKFVLSELEANLPMGYSMSTSPPSQKLLPFEFRENLYRWLELHADLIRHLHLSDHLTPESPLTTIRPLERATSGIVLQVEEKSRLVNAELRLRWLQRHADLLRFLLHYCEENWCAALVAVSSSTSWRLSPLECDALPTSEEPLCYLLSELLLLAQEMLSCSFSFAYPHPTAFSTSARAALMPLLVQCYATHQRLAYSAGGSLELSLSLELDPFSAQHQHHTNPFALLLTLQEQLDQLLQSALQRLHEAELADLHRVQTEPSASDALLASGLVRLSSLVSSLLFSLLSSFVQEATDSAAVSYGYGDKTPNVPPSMWPGIHCPPYSRLGLSAYGATIVIVRMFPLSSQESSRSRSFCRRSSGRLNASAPRSRRRIARVRCAACRRPPALSSASSSYRRRRVPAAARVAVRRHCCTLCSRASSSSTRHCSYERSSSATCARSTTCCGAL